MSDFTSLLLTFSFSLPCSLSFALDGRLDAAAGISFTLEFGAPLPWAPTLTDGDPPLLAGDTPRPDVVPLAMPLVGVVPLPVGVPFTGVRPLDDGAPDAGLLNSVEAVEDWFTAVPLPGVTVPLPAGAPLVGVLPLEDGVPVVEALDSVLGVAAWLTGVPLPGAVVPLPAGDPLPLVDP